MACAGDKVYDRKLEYTCLFLFLFFSLLVPVLPLLVLVDRLYSSLPQSRGLTSYTCPSHRHHLLLPFFTASPAAYLSTELSSASFSTFSLSTYFQDSLDRPLIIFLFSLHD